MIAEPARARRALTMLFVALPLLAFDVRIDQVDLVPDLVGLVLLAVALVWLLSQTADPEAVRWLRAAATVAVVAAPVSVLAEIGVPVHGFWWLSEVALVLALVMLTCIGMEEFTRAAGLARPNAAWVQARWSWAAFVVSALLVVVLTPFEVAGLPWIVAILIGFGAMVLFLVATWRTRAEIA